MSEDDPDDGAVFFDFRMLGDSRLYRFTCWSNFEAADFGFLLVTGDTVAPVYLEMPEFAFDGASGGCVMTGLRDELSGPSLHFDEESGSIVTEPDGTSYTGKLPALRWALDGKRFRIDMASVEAALADMKCR